MTAAATSFRAWCACPKCGHYNCHPLRPPRTTRPGECEVFVWRDGRLVGEMVTDWPAELASQEVRDESVFEVVRTCSTCGTEWGQT